MSNVETLEKNLENQSENLQELKAKAEDAWEDTVDLIRRHPGKAIGASLAAGIALGALAAAASRRRSDSAVDQVRNLVGTGSDAWGRLRSGFEEASCALKDAMEDAVKKFK